MKRLLVLLVLTASTLSAQAPIAGVNALKVGQVRIIASYLGFDGKLVADTMVLNIAPVPIATIGLFNATFPPRWVSGVTVGKTFCAIAQAKDVQGNILTGRKVSFSSSDTLIAKLFQSAGCADTTVDISKMPVISP
jgi:hypothetical protein